MTPDPPAIFSALLAAAIDVGAIGKTDHNAQSNYDFRGIDRVVNAVAPALRRNGVVVVPSVESYEYGTIEVGRARTSMGHARVVVAFRFYAVADGSFIEARVPAEAFDSGDKATGKAASVALRTVLLQALMLPTGDPEPDATTHRRSPRRTEDAASEPRMITDAQLKRIMTLMTRGDIRDREARLAFCREVTGRAIESSKDLTLAEAKQVMTALEAAIAEPRSEDPAS